MEVLRTSIIPIAAAATLGALGLVGAAGSYWVDRRRRELILLAAKGVPPGALGVKAVLEMFLPAIVGLAVGWVVAVAAVPAFGPSDLLDEAVRWRALQVTLVAGVAAMALIGLVAGLRSRALIDRRARRVRRLGLRLVAIVVLVAAAFVAYFRLGENAVAIAEGDAAGTVSPMVLVFPLLLFAAAVAVGAALILRLLPGVQRMGGHLAPAPYLATRRITSNPVLALVLVAASAFPVATLVYSAGLVRSVNATVDAKATSFIGSDVAVAMPDDREPPGSLAPQATHVVRFSREDEAGRDVEVLGIDPTTVAQAVYWDDSFADRSLSDLLDLLNADSAGATLPVIVANGTVSGGSVLASPWDEAAVRIDIVGEANAFPGMRTDRPLVIADRSALLAHLGDGPAPAGLEHSWWVRGMSRAEVITVLNEAGVQFRFITQAQGVLDLAQFITVIRTFDFIQVVGVLAGLIATAGVLLYSDTRQRARNLAYALARRMGLTRRSHTLAGLLEIGTLLMVGLAIGLAAGILGANVVHLRLDPVPRIPPSPLWRGAGSTIGASILATAAVTWVAAWIGQRAADRSDTSEVLRHGD
jgi:putative ABC transport system permease protein